MKKFFIGIIIGILIGLLPIFNPETAYSIYPEWDGPFNSPEKIQVSNNPELKKEKYFILKDNNKIYYFSLPGKLVQLKSYPEEELFTLSGNGKFLVKYQKLGKELEFFNINGERFWKYPANKYPYLSFNAKIVLLQTADLSEISILDNNGNKIGEQSITGRFCTNIVFSKINDFAAIGFLDGNYYLLDKLGKIIINGQIPANNAVKSLNISDNGQHLVVHYGNSSKDGILTLNAISKKKTYYNLPEKHLTKTAVHITDSEQASIINQSRFFIIDQENEKIRSIPISRQKAGHAKINFKNKIYTISYRRKNGGSDFKIITAEGRLLLTRTFPDEPYLDNQINDNAVLVRGKNNLYCWSFELADD